MRIIDASNSSVAKCGRLNQPVQRARLSATVAIVTVLFAVSFGCASKAKGSMKPTSSESATPRAASHGALQLENRTGPIEKGGSFSFERGVLQVPVNRRKGSAASLGFEFFRFPYKGTGQPAPPIFVLKGGPGFPGLGEALENDRYYLALVEPYLEIADVIVPGQRGFGGSRATPCAPMRELTIQEALNPSRADEATIAATTACRQRYEEEGLDLTGFNVNEAAADVAAVAKSLGYPQIQLIGTSFGSHLGIAIVRNYPEIVARATFSGLEGPDHTYDMPSSVLNAVKRILTSAEQSPQLRGLIPPGGLLAAYKTRLAELDRSPVSVEVEHPRSKEKLTIALTGDMLRSVALGYTGSTAFRHRMRGYPLDLLAMINGDFGPAAQRVIDIATDGELADASYYQLDCGSGISQERGARLRADPAAAVLGKTWLAYDTPCAAWDADVGEDFRRGFVTDVPTLLVQGNWDTSTPYENAVEVQSMFRNHRFIHIEGGSHGAMREAREQASGFDDSLKTWWKAGRFDHIPERVMLPALDWLTPAEAKATEAKGE